MQTAVGFVPWATHTLFFSGSSNVDAVLSTREKRNSWEKSVEAIILPELEVSEEGDGDLCPHLGTSRRGFSWAATGGHSAKVTKSMRR